MTNMLNTLSTIGALVMAATPLVAVADIAHAADYTPQVVQVGDLQFSRPADIAQFRRRVDVAASNMCGSRDLTAAAACRSAVQEEAVQRLSSERRQALQTAETTSQDAWRVASK